MTDRVRPGDRARATVSSCGRVTVSRRDFWRGRRVFLTGHTGFKGSWLSMWLQSLGADVTGYALAPLSGGLFDAAQVASGMRSLEGDVRDGRAFARAIEEARPEVAFHLAAQPFVRTSYLLPVETFETNVMGTTHFLEALRRCSDLRGALVVTSDKCYSPSDDLHAEESPLGGADPYSASKACAEMITSAFRNSFFKDGPPIASARVGNVLGGGDWGEDRLVPDAMRALASGSTLVVRRPNDIRPWQHVLDVLQGYLMLAEKLCHDGLGFAEAWNFGPPSEEAQPVSAVVCRLQERSAGRLRVRMGDGGSWPETHELRLDSRKVRGRLGWSNRLGFEDVVSWTFDWYDGYLSSKDSARALVLEQLRRYLQRDHGFR